MNIPAVIAASFALIPDLIRAGKLEQAEGALSTVAPILMRGKLTASSIADLHSSGELVEFTQAIASLGTVLDAVLTSEPGNANHVTNLLTAIGLPDK